jgi:N-acetylmuramoyl-L-alanine amidase
MVDPRWRARRPNPALLVVALLASGCAGTVPGAGPPLEHHEASPTSSPTTVSPSSAMPSHTAVGSASTAPPSTTPRQPLAGVTIGVDPGHNGLNYTDPATIDAPVWNGREDETCNTTGTETDSGYTEAEFNWNVSQYLEADLKSEGAKVVLTRSSNDGVGPCVNIRSEILNATDIAVAIHADGGPPTGRGFAILEPVADGLNDGVVADSEVFGTIVRDRFQTETGMPTSTYDGTDGIVPRDDLAGTNLTTVPYVLIECGNMRNASDAAQLVTPTFQQEAARALADALTVYREQSLSA